MMPRRTEMSRWSRPTESSHQGEDLPHICDPVCVCGVCVLCVCGVCVCMVCVCVCVVCVWCVCGVGVCVGRIYFVCLSKCGRLTPQATYHRNWMISACAHGVNSRALCAYIRECAYNTVIFEPHPVTGCLCEEG